MNKRKILRKEAEAIAGRSNFRKHYSRVQIGYSGELLAIKDGALEVVSAHVPGRTEFWYTTRELATTAS